MNLDDDHLETLLRETFERHEHLADASVRATPRRSPSRAPIALAAVAVVGIVGAAALAGRGSEQAAPTNTGTTGPTTSVSSTSNEPDQPAPTTPGFDPGPTTGQNRDAARARIGRSLGAITEYLGGLTPPALVVADSAVPAFDPPTFSSGGGSTYLSRIATFISTATDPEAIARSIDASPPPGFVSEGVGGHSNADGSWSQDLFLDPAPHDEDPHEMASITLSLTAAGPGTGIRAEVGSAYRTQRTLDTAVALDDATTAVVRRNLVGGPVTDPDDLARLVERFNALPTWPELFHSCPASAEPSITLRLSSSLGDLRASWVPCYRSWDVRGEGRQLGWLEDSSDEPLADLVERLARQVD